jgi:hypothetical protein
MIQKASNWGKILNKKREAATKELAAPLHIEWGPGEGKENIPPFQKIATYKYTPLFASMH